MITKYETPNSPILHIAEDAVRVKNILAEYDGELKPFGNFNHQMTQKDGFTEIALRQGSVWPMCGFIAVEV